MQTHRWLRDSACADEPPDKVANGERGTQQNDKKCSCYVGFYVTFHLRCALPLFLRFKYDGRGCSLHNYLKGNIITNQTSVLGSVFCDISVAAAFWPKSMQLFQFSRWSLSLWLQFSTETKMKVWRSISFTAFVTLRSVFDGIYCQLTRENMHLCRFRQEIEFNLKYSRFVSFGRFGICLADLSEYAWKFRAT